MIFNSPESATQDQSIEVQATAYLKKWFSANAQFKPGQLEAIKAVMQHQRTLVVEQTGWGKSLIYFMCCRLFKRSRLYRRNDGNKSFAHAHEQPSRGCSKLWYQCRGGQ